MLLPFFLVRFIITRRFRTGLGERLTLYGPKFRKSSTAGSIWVQAASVGEVRAVLPLIELLREEYPERRIVLTCQTATGRGLGRKELGWEHTVILAPLDSAPFLQRFYRIFSPEILILVETEIWPGAIISAARRGLPVIMINGRISPGSFRGYLKIRPLLAPVLKKISSFNMRTAADARRIIGLGALEETVSVTGNIKFDSLPADISSQDKKGLAARLKVESKDKILVGGSTFAGEERILYRVFTELTPRFPELILILAPRYLERIGELEAFFRKEKEPVSRFTQLKATGREGRRVILVDRMGVLFSLYSLAAAVFIGRSLRGSGGQNPIEPASLGKPVLFGPRMDNFRTIARDLVGGGGAVEVRSEKELKEELTRILSSSETALKMGERARAVVSSRKGASWRNLEKICRVLAKRSED